jgi:Arc/MetJ family transcription regulator
MTKVRTNIEIEDDYVQMITRRYHLRTKIGLEHPV